MARELRCVWVYANGNMCRRKIECVLTFDHGEYPLCGTHLTVVGKRYLEKEEEED